MSDYDKKEYVRDQGEAGRRNADDRSGGGPPSSDRGGNDAGGYRGTKMRTYFRKKVCRFCTQKYQMDYKKPETLQRFLTDRGKILPRRITGTCAKHQRTLATVIKRARAIALLPFVKQ